MKYAFKSKNPFIILILIAGVVIVSLLMITKNSSKINTAGNQSKSSKYTPPSHKLFGVNVAGAEFDNIAFYAGNEYKGYAYFNKKGLTLMRLPFKWERLQPTLNGPFSSDINKYTDMILAAQKAGDRVIIEPHNYAQYNSVPLTSQDVASFDDLWGRLSQKYSTGYPTIWGYELMNEPHDLSGGCETWKTLAQSAIYSIRKVDHTHYILVPGYDWQSASNWASASNCLASIKDPANKLLFSAHQYFDNNQSGSQYDSSTCTDTNRGVELIQPFLYWLKKNNATGIFTEYGVPGDNACWLATLNKFISTLKRSDHIIGGTYWSAGPAWGNYNLSVEPDNNGDKPQMQILDKYPSY